MQIIRETLRNNKRTNPEDIAFGINEKFGLSEKFTIEYCKQLKKRGLI